MVKCPPLRAGDLVGVVAPAGVVDVERLAVGTAALERLGYRTRIGAHALDRARYLAGDDEARRADLQPMLDDPAVRAVIAARGGYGCQRLVPELDLAGLHRAPKLVVGYSDVTALLTTIVRSGLVAVHGPMAAADFARGLSPASETHFVRLVSDPAYVWTASVPTPLRPGRAEGPLVGGCLSLLTALLGTPLAPVTEGAILFLEDTREWPYRIDRLLTQARQAGLFDRVAGVVLGTFETCPQHDQVNALDIIRDEFADAPFPVGFGLQAGHTAVERRVEQTALPLGVRVRFDADAGLLTALESPLERL
jgi:muramoyltetrapeptide carboxypeptidase